MTPPHVLNGAFERVARAEEHLRDLRLQIARWLLEQEDAVILKFDPQPPHERIVDTRNCIGPPLIVGILIGEIAYNLRSALDYLVFKLAKLDSGVDQDFTQFPIVDTGDKFRAWRKDARRKGINDAHIAAIKRLQPCEGCDWSAYLRDISNTDKHREFTPIKGGWTILLSAPLTEADIAELAVTQRRARRAHHPVHGEVDVKLTLQSTITLNDGAPVADTLEKIQLKVAEALTAFKPEF